MVNIRGARSVMGLLLIGYALLALSVSVDEGWSLALGPRPPLEKECGSIQIQGERLRVDITETIDMQARGCRSARTVMRKFIKTSPPVMGDGQVHDHGRTYNCYRSRLDGEGWDYHCGWSSSGTRFRFIDFGAGRRFGKGASSATRTQNRSLMIVEYQRCRDVVIRNSDGGIYTRTHGLFQKRAGCVVARRLARRYLANDGIRPPRILGFTCEGGTDGVACRNGEKRVTWGYYYD